MGGMSGPDGYWNTQQTMPNGQGHQISIDTGLQNNGRSLPNTPATTPPGNSIQSMQSYPPVTQGYDNSRQMYQTSAPPPSSYSPHPGPQERPMYAQSAYVKNEMAPPSSRGGATNGEQADAKSTNGVLQPRQGEAVNGTEEEADHEHDGEYTHDSGAYDSNRGPYNYSAQPVSSLQSDHSHLQSDLSGSPHQAGSGRATPRTAAAPQPYYPSQDYGSSSSRVGQTSSNLYSGMSNERSSSNGTPANDAYGNQGDMGSSMPNGYSSQPAMNGIPSMKRGRDDDDDRSDLKRRKGMLESTGSVPSPTFQPTATPVSRVRR
jgi:protein SOK2